MTAALVLYLLAVVTIFLRKSSGFPTSGSRIRVRVTNDLSSGEILYVHCKSKDDDLALQTLSKGKSFEFRFTVDFWNSTILFCKMTWSDGSHWFDVFKVDRDNCKRCLWSVREYGVCRLDFSNNLSDMCYSWNKN